ncbi:PLP-dependent aminotransferase family protein [Floccifex sp.]|uniref:MocR-like pyridoxine biosynthesis transcription factor PdxR n=1 Tax=Floccifex sp. TaxID=2815810 RepID=UPI002A765981|nr:PLP-dependent aminotransferase family protein [Floccifex sp.]MDD7281168.1 PLP-dependent aminotransferase family protein [Erysipelotrichaceae bacterium]MDY2958802.1 PLP-dependent aminotransferase family protein [Floccifex sp.]
MKYTITKENHVNAYMQLYNQIKNDIINNTLHYQDKLPSKRQMALDIQTSVITVEHAYSILMDEGYIEARQRSGYYVIYQDSEWYSNPSENTIEVMHQSHTLQQDTFSSHLYAKAIRKVLQENEEAIMVKSPNLGCEELKNAISQYLKRNRGIEVENAQIIIGSGAEYLYGLITQMIGNEYIYALENPGYEKIRKVYQANHIQIDLLKMGNDGIQSEQLLKTKAKVLHVTPYNSYPSGVSSSISKRNEYIRFAKERNGFIIEDDFDSEFCLSTKIVDTIYSLEPNNCVIYMNSFSKTIAPSIRIAYMVLPKNYTKQFCDKINFYSCTVPTLDQYVLAEILNNGDFERHINRIRRKLRKELI